MVVLIPSYQPDSRLVDVVRTLRESAAAAEVLVVDDGSGPGYEGVFRAAAEAGATVVGYAVNRGKGAALKSGFRWVAEHRPGETVVCADSDGQHRVDDILRVAAAVEPRRMMVIGGRRFTGDVPPRSRFGNTVTRHLFRLVSGASVYDTQSGLRGYPSELLGWLIGIPGERFEYELTMLVAASDAGVEIREVEIATVYYPTAYSSHFRTVVDSWRVYRQLLSYAVTRRRPGGAGG